MLIENWGRLLLFVAKQKLTMYKSSWLNRVCFLLSMVAVSFLLLTVFISQTDVDSTMEKTTYQIPLAINTWAFINATSVGKLILGIINLVYFYNDMKLKL